MWSRPREAIFGCQCTPRPWTRVGPALVASGAMRVDRSAGYLVRFNRGALVVLLRPQPRRPDVGRPSAEGPSIYWKEISGRADPDRRAGQEPVSSSKIGSMLTCFQADR